MFENKFDMTLEEVSVTYGLNWSDDSKVRILARFLKEYAPQLFPQFEDWLEREANNEILGVPNDHSLDGEK